ncbi:hypothetical protein D3C87_280210 [compost metagenome]
MPQPQGLINGNFQITVYPQWFKQCSLSWTVPASWGEVHFNVYFSQSQEQEYVKLNSTPIIGNYFIDTTSTEYSKYRHGWYVVEALLKDKNDIRLRSDPVTWTPSQRNFVRIRSVEIQRREYWLLSKFVGIKSYLFRRKNYGKRCTACWNYEAETVDDDHCPICLGTGFEGGFFEPIPVFLQYEATPNNDQRVYYGLDEASQVGAWTISYPDIRTHDVIVRTGDFTAYEVLRINPTELQGNPVRQILALAQLGKNSVEYKLISKNLPEFPAQYWSD